MNEKFTAFVEMVKRYSGYTRFISPYWAMYTDWIAAHPKSIGALLIALLVFGLR